jgi:hypothetical protein
VILCITVARAEKQRSDSTTTINAAGNIDTTRVPDRLDDLMATMQNLTAVPGSARLSYTADASGASSASAKRVQATMQQPWRNAQLGSNKKQKTGVFAQLTTYQEPQAFNWGPGTCWCVICAADLRSFAGDDHSSTWCERCWAANDQADGVQSIVRGGIMAELALRSERLRLELKQLKLELEASQIEDELQKLKLQLETSHIEDELEDWMPSMPGDIDAGLKLELRYELQGNLEHGLGACLRGIHTAELQLRATPAAELAHIAWRNGAGSSV